MLELRRGTPDDAPAALELWRAASAARGRRPADARVARVQQKLVAPDALLVLAELADRPVGMALAEPGREHDGAGEVVPGLLHLSMLFVAPDRWRTGVGAALVEGLADAGWVEGYRHLSVWTGRDNGPARGLYAACGLEPSGRSPVLVRGTPVVQYVAELEAPVREVAVGAGVRLGQLLKLAGLVDTGSQAKQLLTDGGVLVNREVELRRGRQLTDGDLVEAVDQAVRVVAHPEPPASGT